MGMPRKSILPVHIKKIIPAWLVLLFMATTVFAQAPGERSYISDNTGKGHFAIVVNGSATALYVSSTDFPGVLIAAKNLQSDIRSVTDVSPQIVEEPIAKQLIIIGTIGKGGLIDQLIRQKKLDVSTIAGKWEAHITQVIQNSLPGVKSALIIAGSDKRGTIYGIYGLSAQIGVSPWHWWADVPVKHRDNLYVIPGKYVDEGPAVKYRGIFINDEAPAFSGWAKEKFGGINHLAYEKVFELILRLKGNYLWPAMWGNAFNDDDKLDPVLADEYGIVMGTSHHEPMNRAQQEWKRYGTGAWNYETNGAVLRDFWKKGIENMGNKETLVTIGMRGDGDMPMTDGSNIALLEKIVSDQRKIIADVTGKDASETPQIWALYKEVQDYYDKGMRVPDDVTLLLSDDNWGNIRKLPKLGSPLRKGGYGIYYHFDYVGDPRNYKWLNTNQISKVWEQMHLAYEYNARQVWIVNVGDLKPMEYPISFFLDYAWSPNSWPASRLESYTKQWAAQQFGDKYADEIAKILTLYTKYNARRKPELLDENTYSLVNYHEFDNVVADYDKLRDEAVDLYRKMPAEYKDAYYQLVLHPVEACANLNELYYYTAKNKLYAAQGLAAANAMADSVKNCFERDSLIAHYYNKILANGKWDHMMDQTHIGYTGWQEPPVNKMPEVKTISLTASPKMEENDQKTSVEPVLTHTMEEPSVFYEHDGYIAIEAEHYSKAVGNSAANWMIIPDYGRTLSGVTPTPVTAKSQEPGGNSPHLEYKISLADTGKIAIEAYISPTIDFTGINGLHYAVSIDDEQPQVVNINADRSQAAWSRDVSDNIKKLTTIVHISTKGRHVLKYWMVDPGVVLQKLVINAGGEKPSYLGPPESRR
jgi:hypothetical protein